MCYIEIRWNAINQNRPVYCSDSGHIVVAYDYDAYLVAWEMNVGDMIELRIDISNMPVNVALDTFIMELE